MISLIYVFLSFIPVYYHYNINTFVNIVVDKFIINTPVFRLANLKMLGFECIFVWAKSGHVSWAQLNYTL